MGYLPIFVELDGRRCIVVGGGEVASRKVASLLDAGAQVTVVSEQASTQIAALATAGAITHWQREWHRGDLRGFDLAFAATSDPAVHREIAAEARTLGVMVNIADEPELCDFIAPAVLRRGDLQIAVSTAGASPAMASRIRRDLEAVFGDEYGAALIVMRAARAFVKRVEPDIAARGRRLQSIASEDIAGLIRVRDRDGLERVLVRHLGVDLAALGLETKELFAPDPVGDSRTA